MTRSKAFPYTNTYDCTLNNFDRKYCLKKVPVFAVSERKKTLTKLHKQLSDKYLNMNFNTIAQ